MKTECDKSGLEYELIMQESAKERFMRHVPADKTIDFSKHLILLKTKRQSNSTSSDPIVGAAPTTAIPPSDPIVGASQDQSDPIVGSAAPKVKSSKAGFADLAGLGSMSASTLLMQIRNMFPSPFLMVTLPTTTTTKSPLWPSFKKLAKPGAKNSPLIVQPGF